MYACCEMRQSATFLRNEWIILPIRFNIPRAYRCCARSLSANIRVSSSLFENFEITAQLEFTVHPDQRMIGQDEASKEFLGILDQILC